MRDDLTWRFDYHPPEHTDIAKMHTAIRQAMLDAARTVELLCTDSRERALAYTKLEEAMFWANADIARNRNEEFAHD